jgi:hypothetical protein
MLTRAAAAVALAVACLAGLGSAAQAATSPSPSPTPTSSGSPASGANPTVWFGPELDWDADSPDGYAERLGETPALYAIRLSYPLDQRSTERWQSAATEVAAQGAVLVLRMEPTVPLADLTPDDAVAFNRELESIHDQYGTTQLVNFAPEMNGSWTAWGQDPTYYASAFRRVAQEVHGGTSTAAMLWEPSYGAGYPFDRADGRLESLTQRDLVTLDTNHDGTLSEADDPYGPYYPGDEAVDRVGLSMYYFGKGEAGAAAGRDVPLTSNMSPAPGEVEARLDERWGYLVPQSDTFYDRFAVGDDRQMLLDTGALYDHQLGGDTELSVKQGWWQQVLDALPGHPKIDAVAWLELERVEAEAGDQKVDWRATSTSELATALRDDLNASGLIIWGPITAVVTAQDGQAATVQVRDGSDGGDEMNWIAGCAGVLAVAFLASGIVGRALPKWRYPDDSSTRDLRIDMVRGFIIVVVVVTHIEVTSPFSFFALKAVGAITGAELFVLLSGLVLGMVYPLAVKRAGEWSAAVGAWARARKQYIVALAVILLIFILGTIPFIDASAITTFTDRGTGAGGSADTGRVYDLYPNVDRLLDYPPPWYAIQQFLLLEMGPWPFNIMGLFVVLSLAVPALMWLIRRKMWWVVLLVSWALYFVALFFPDYAPLPSQFEAVFPLFVWQLLFTNGLVIGYYRRQLIRALTTPIGKIAAGAFVVAYAGFLGYLWAGQQFGFVPVPFSADLWSYLYGSGYERINLHWGRLLDLVLVMLSSYAVLTVAWKPFNKSMGWLWIPLGQASLYVFIVHVFFVLAVANIPGLDRSSLWQGTLIHSFVIGIIFFMVQKKFLFKVIPR